MAKTEFKLKDTNLIQLISQNSLPKHLMVPISIEKLGCKTVEKKGREVKFITGEDEDLKNVKGFIGVEFEGRYGGGIVTERRVLEKLLKIPNKFLQEADISDNKVMSSHVISHYNNSVRLLQSVYTDINNIKTIGTNTFITQALKVLVIKLFSEVVYDFPHPDGGGIESVFSPMSEKAIRNLIPLFDKFLSLYKELGFSDKLPGAGIHLYIDYTLFGNNVDAQQVGLRNFLWFLFLNNEDMVDISSREFSSQAYSDMRSQLGDYYGIMSQEELLEIFLNVKNNFLETFIRKAENRYLNIHLSRDGRPAIEFRWFSSTLELNKFIAFIEFTIGLVNFCNLEHNDPSSLKMNAYLDFIVEDLERYSHAFEYLLSFESISSQYNNRENYGENKTILNP